MHSVNSNNNILYSLCVYHIYIVKINLGGGLIYYVDQIVRTKES